MSERRASQFTVRRFFVAMVWVSLSGVFFQLLQEVHQPASLEWALAAATVGLFGVGISSIFGRPLTGGFLVLAIWLLCAVFG